jgi:hypothetical protein
VFVWGYMISQNWDVYAPGFRSLSQNVVYVESETEFDINEAEEKHEDHAAKEPDEVRQALPRSCSVCIPVLHPVHASVLMFVLKSVVSVFCCASRPAAIVCSWMLQLLPRMHLRSSTATPRRI